MAKGLRPTQLLLFSSSIDDICQVNKMCFTTKKLVNQCLLVWKRELKIFQIEIIKMTTIGTLSTAFTSSTTFDNETSIFSVILQTQTRLV